MEITFKDKKIRKFSSDYNLCVRKMGEMGATLFFKRLNALRDATTLEEVRNLPGRFHELKEDRKGQWGCDLVHPMRMIFTPHENPVPTNKHGQYIWQEITGIEVIELIDYH